MKNLNLKKLLLMLAVVIIVQNGVIIASNVNGNTGSSSDEYGIAPCSDLPVIDESYN